MKMNGAKQVHYDSGPNMTPLVDVVMVILIFLMLAGSFGTGSQFLMSKAGIHQKGSGGKATKVDPDQPPDIEVHIDNAGDGFSAVVGKYKPTNSAATLKDELDSIHSEYIAAGKPSSKLQVVLYPSKRLRYWDLIACYDAALRANFEKTAMASSH
jgi:biopolymer transport protein ExbD